MVTFHDAVFISRVDSFVFFLAASLPFIVDMRLTGTDYSKENFFICDQQANSKYIAVDVQYGIWGDHCS